MEAERELRRAFTWLVSGREGLRHFITASAASGSLRPLSFEQRQCLHFPSTTPTTAPRSLFQSNCNTCWSFVLFENISSKYTNNRGSRDLSQLRITGHLGDLSKGYSKSFEIEWLVTFSEEVEKLFMYRRVRQSEDNKSASLIPFLIV